MFLKFQACPSWRLRNWCTIAVLGSQIHMDFFFFSVEEIEESVLILEKNVLIIFIYGLNFSFEMLF